MKRRGGSEYLAKPSQTQNTGFQSIVSQEATHITPLVAGIKDGLQKYKKNTKESFCVFKQ